MTNPKVWKFDRYLNGQRMAEGVRIERAGTFEEACRSAVALASPGSVLVVRQSDEITQLRGNLSLAEEGLANYALEVERLKHDNERLMKSLNAEVNAHEPLLGASFPRVSVAGIPIVIIEDPKMPPDQIELWNSTGQIVRTVGIKWDAQCPVCKKILQDDEVYGSCMHNNGQHRRSP